MWTKTANRKDVKQASEDPWTTFCLPSRDPYALPDLAELGEFLAASLTFTQSLQSIAVYVNDIERLKIDKTTLVPPRPVTRPNASSSSSNGDGTSSSSWWKSLASSDTASVTQSPQGLFRLPAAETALQESVVQVAVRLDAHEAVTQARFITATALTNLGRTLLNRMERVTKKQPPKQVTISLFLNYDLHQDDDDKKNATSGSGSKKKKNPARRVTQSLAPPAGAGRIFIVRIKTNQQVDD